MVSITYKILQTCCINLAFAALPALRTPWRGQRNQQSVIISMTPNLRPHADIASDAVINYNSSNIFLKMSEELNFIAILHAISVYNETFGTTKISKEYYIPQDARYPSSLHGRKLNDLISDLKRNIRFNNFTDKAHALENALGISIFRARTVDFQATVAALRVYKTLYGNVNVPQKFDVPYEAPWPSQTWGMALGVKVKKIRQCVTFTSPEQIRILEELGFDYDAQIDIGYESIELRVNNNLFILLNWFLEFIL
jgi:hypothetical protein